MHVTSPPTHKVAIQDFLDPDFIFASLLEGNESKLRYHLIDPAVRSSIRKSLNS
jgi:hypothetical protein